MSTSLKRLKMVYICLMGVTLLSLGLTSDIAHSFLPVKGIATIAAIFAFIKARYVVSDFMELRGTSMQRAFDLWLIVLAVASLTLAFR